MAGAEISKIESVTDVKCNSHKFYEMMKNNLHDLPSIFPEAYTDSKILEGDGKSEGSVRTFKYILPGTSDEMFVKTKTLKQDDDDMKIVLFVEEGDLHNHYKHLEATVQVFPKGDGGSLVKWILEFEKHSDEIADPHSYLELAKKLNEKVDAHLHKE